MKAIPCNIIVTILLNCFALSAVGQEQQSDLADPAFRRTYVEKCTEQLKLTPNDYRLYVTRGTIYAWERKLPEALSDAKRADQLQPNEASTKSLLGQLAVMQGRFVDAVPQYTAAIAVEPKSAGLYNNRAVAYLKLGKLADAQKDLSISIQLDPKMGVAYEGLGEVMFAYGKYADCIKYCNQALKLNGSNEEAYYFRGCAYERLGNKSQAKIDKERAVKMGYDGKITFK